MRYLLLCAAFLGLAGQAAAQPADKVTINELVAPIALYPDVLVAQVLVASTHPDEIVNATSWLDAERPWDSRELAQEVDGNAWHPDIKALVLMRPVLDGLRRNFAWTAALGVAYTRHPEAVLDAVQALRHAALAAGELTSTSGQRVIVSGATILLEPVDPQFVYVPGGGVFDVGAYDRFAWGWHGWQVGWKDGVIRYQDAPYAALQTGLRP